ncbi:MAG TPA: hydrolase [Nitrosopumilus sp.]|nr:hydrolase [Nitrosopumilus sp.]
MSDSEKDALVEAQKQVIGILFEVIKRLQANNDLDEEYFQIIASKKTQNKKRLDEILSERQENSKIVSKLLKQLEI